MNERERIVRTLRGERTRQLPWATRLDIWYNSRQRTGNMPAAYAGKEIMEIYRAVRLGRQRYASLLTERLRGVELSVEFEGEHLRRETDPCLAFPNPLALAVADRPGETTITFKTPAGTARVRYLTNIDLIRGAAVPYMTEHILKDDDDFRVVKWILEHLDVLPSFQAFLEAEEAVGDDGFTIGMVQRVPLQRLLLEFMGEEHAIYAMSDSPTTFRFLLDALAEQSMHGMQLALESPSLVLELPDNFDGMITSPRLFRQHCIPFLQRMADMVHPRGRLLASHMDGNMKPLLDLVPQSGLDVVESFSPAPLSQLEFAAAWHAWRDKVLIWGGIPSPIFEAHVPAAEFEAWVQAMLDLIGDDGRIILGIGDQAMGPTLIERVERVSEMLGR